MNSVSGGNNRSICNQRRLGGPCNLIWVSLMSRHKNLNLRMNDSYSNVLLNDTAPTHSLMVKNGGRSDCSIFLFDTSVARGAKQHRNFARNSPSTGALSLQVQKQEISTWTFHLCRYLDLSINENIDYFLISRLNPSIPTSHS